jgi:hypothetical protein
VLAREGDVLDRLGGSAAANGDLNVCFTSPKEYQEVVRHGCGARLGKIPATAAARHIYFRAAAAIAWAISVSQMTTAW